MGAPQGVDDEPLDELRLHGAVPRDDVLQSSVREVRRSRSGW